MMPVQRRLLSTLRSYHSSRYFAAIGSTRCLSIARVYKSNLQVTTATRSDTPVPSSIRFFSADVPSDLSLYYRIEVSNAAREDTTKLTIRGPNVDGSMASMTVALAQKGCSIVEVTAGSAYYKDADVAYRSKRLDITQEHPTIEDVFYVVQSETGKAFDDAALMDLGQAVLKALGRPMKTIQASQDWDARLSKAQQYAPDEQIVVVTSNERPKYYRIQVSNAARSDATQLTVRGPDVFGMMASMTVALAREGCSVMELTAGISPEDDGEIEDVFYVVNYETGKPYPDEELEHLGQCLLEALRMPGGTFPFGAEPRQVEETLAHAKQYSAEEQISVVWSK